MAILRLKSDTPDFVGVGANLASATITPIVDISDVSTSSDVAVARKPRACEQRQRICGDADESAALLLAKQQEMQLLEHVASSSSLIAGPERVAADVMRNGVLDYIARCERGALGLFSAQLTISNMNADIEGAAADLATFIASVPGQGAFLVLDVSPTERPHLHGLVIAEDARAAIGEWCALTHSDSRGQRLTRITGSTESWEIPASPKLSGNISNVLWYAVKLKYPPATVLTDRVLAACGALYGPWVAARAAILPLLRPAVVRPGNPSTRRPNLSTCARCGRSLEHLRRDAKSCGGSCRTLLSRARLMSALVPKEELKAVYAVVQHQPKASLRAIAAHTQLPLEHVRRALWELDDRGAALGATR